MGEPELRLLLVVFVGLTAVFVVAYYQLRLRLGDAVNEALASWKKRELEELRAQLWQAAQSQADARLERWRVEAEGEIRADAVRRSTAVVSGKVSEHLAPYMDAFPYNPKDARFLGTPVDLLVFDGMSEDDLREIVFLEIKSGGATLTTRERRVRDAVLARRVVWKEFRVGD
jgi:predicted Holliday junction resolvase-like endonuclease